MSSYFCVLQCVLAIVVGFSSASAQDANLLAAAKREGRVVWYSSVGESQQFAQEFEKKYPFIKVDVVRGTVYPLMNRILNEAAAGNYLFDVVRQATLTIGLLIQRGLVQPYESPERAAYAAGWKDKQGYWTSTDDNYFVIGYNTRQVSAAEAPKDWDDLLAPKWRGKIGMDPDNHILYGALEQSWGRDKAISFFRRLAQQQIQFRKGNTLISQLIVAGISAGFCLRSSGRVSQIAKSADGLGFDNESDRHYRRSAGAGGQSAQPQCRQAPDRFSLVERRAAAVEEILPHSIPR